MVGYGIRCPRCDGLYSEVDETRGDPERRVPVIVRIRTCIGCGAQLETIEVLARAGASRVLLPDSRAVLRAIRSRRHALARGAMVSGSEMAGEHMTPGRGT